MKYDYKTLYNKNAEWYNAHPTAKEALKLFNIFLSWLFVFSYAVTIFQIIQTHALEPRAFAWFLFLPLLCLMLVSMMRLGFDRPRPYSEDGANIAPLIKKKGNGKSFPSRHVACAFVIATVILAHYLLAGIFLLFTAVLLAYIRLAAGLHYPSDVFVGAGIGLLGGLVIFFI